MLHMKIVSPHPWKVSPAEGIEIQRRLRNKLIKENRLSHVDAVAGIDVGVKRGVAKAAVIVLEYPSLAPLEQALVSLPVEMPYIPGLLAFREAPAILRALEGLERGPDLFILDGQGIAHPRRMGIATHIGIIVDKPTIGCAKSRLTGSHSDPQPEGGSYTYLYDRGETIGAVLRTRTNIAPIYVSIGHKVDLETAIHYVLSCCRGFRLPETTRLAHKVAAGERLVAGAPRQGLLPL